MFQSWMCSRNMLEFLRQRENDMNEDLDDKACEGPTHLGHTTSRTIGYALS